MKIVAGLILFAACAFMPSIGVCQDSKRQMLGLNKLELVEQYLGTASGGDGSAKYKEVTVPMARKSIEDAADMGAAFLRVGVAGFWPNQPGQKSDLDLWQRDPQAYWQVMDSMFSDLAARQLGIVPLFVWNISQFSAITGDGYANFLRDPDSGSYKLLERYVREFVSRYKTHKSIVFYDLANEFNVSADLDVESRCAKGRNAPFCANPTNVTTGDVIAFLTRLATLIRSLDSTHQISGGYSINRPAAQYLRHLPEWKGQKADLVQDDYSQFVQNLRDMNNMADIISVHIYPSRENRRFGIRAGEESRMLEYVKRAADEIGKPVFVGEFGEYDSMRAASPGGFSDRVMKDLIRLNIAYAALWGLEFYPRKPYYDQLGRQELGSVEFGYTDYVISRFMETAVAMGQKVSRVGVRDDIPPRVVLTWPLECTPIGNEQLVYAVASDNSLKVNRVDFVINEQKLVSVTMPPYQSRLDPGKFAPGVYAIQAHAYDDAGNESVSKRLIVVDGGTKGDSIPCP